MIIGVDMGHSLSGVGTGAVGIVKEVDKNREVGNKLIAMLREKGHTVINCTVDSASSTSAQLQGITKKANTQRLDLFISLHLNSFNGQAYGVETYTYLGARATTKETANRIQSKLVANVGWYNRGVKEQNFHVLRETVAPAILVELGFCDSKRDMDLWNADKIAKALFEGITNTVYTPPAPPTPPASSTGNTMFRVVAGTYSDRANAEAQQAKLKKAGFDSFLVAYNK